MRHIHNQPVIPLAFAAVCFTLGWAVTAPALCQDRAAPSRSVLRNSPATSPAAPTALSHDRAYANAEPANELDDAKLQFDHEPRPEGPLGQPAERQGLPQSAAMRRADSPLPLSTPAARWPAQNARAAQPAIGGGILARPTGTPRVEEGRVRTRSLQNAPAAQSGAVRRPSPAASPSIEPNGLDQLPSSLPGTWKVSLCIAGEQSWIRFEQVKTGEFHTLSRSTQGSSKKNERSGAASGIQWDLDVQRESELTSTSHVLVSVTGQNPRIFRGADKERGYGPSTGNCAGFTRDAWHFYSHEWYPLPSPPSSTILRDHVLRQHAERPAAVSGARREQSRQRPPSARR